MVTIAVDAPGEPAQSIVEEYELTAASELSAGSELTADSSMSAWRRRLAPYTRSSVLQSSMQILTSVVTYLVLAVITYLSISVSPLLALALAPLAGGFLVRTFIVFHDCTHGSFLPSSRANTWLGRLCGLLTLSPFARWRHDHAVHHATAGDLDRRGSGRTGRGQAGRCCVIADHAGRSLGHRGGQRKTLAAVRGPVRSRATDRFVIGKARG